MPCTRCCIRCARWLDSLDALLLLLHRNSVMSAPSAASSMPCATSVKNGLDASSMT